RSLGSQLRPSLAVVDKNGEVLAQVNVGAATSDPVLIYTARSGGPVWLRVTDPDYGGSSGHFYRIAAGASAYVQAVFPLGAEVRQTAKIGVSGSNLGTVTQVTMPIENSAKTGTLLRVPVVLSQGQRPVESRTVVVAAGSQVVEVETNDDGSHAQSLAVPGGA